MDRFCERTLRVTRAHTLLPRGAGMLPPRARMARNLFPTTPSCAVLSMAAAGKLYRRRRRAAFSAAGGGRPTAHGDARHCLRAARVTPDGRVLPGRRLPGLHRLPSAHAYR